MTKIRYGVAMSLDGYIAGPEGEYDWIVQDPEINFAEIFAQFDTLLMGRHTYKVATDTMGPMAFGEKKVIVVSRTLRPADHRNATVVSEVSRDWLQNLRSQAKKDIWLFGGGQLAATVLKLGELDAIDVGVIPVILGGGIPLIGGPVPQTRLKLTSHKIYKSGIMSVKYEVPRG